MLTDILKLIATLISRVSKRIPHIFAGYLAACSAGAILLFLLPSILASTDHPAALTEHGVVPGGLIAIVLFGGLYVFWFSIMRTLAIIALTEIAGIRSRYWYLAAGAIIATAWYMFGFQDLQTDADNLPHEVFSDYSSIYWVLYFAASGALSGFIYWAIAIRWAEHRNLGPYNFLGLIKSTIFDSTSSNAP